MMAQSEGNSSGMPSAVYDQNARNDQSDLNHGDSETNTGNNGNNPGNSHAFPNLGRQSSIYSLTLDEFQHALSENGKNFGSMNMDEFLSSIWSAEENQAHHGNQQHDNPNANANTNNSTPMPTIAAASASCSGGMIAKQPSLARQGSLTLPAPLCRKTVDEVWTEIQRAHQQEQHPPSQQHAANENSNSTTQRQPTFGEMTLEDFLVKAGVVREPCVQPLLSIVPPGPPALKHHHPPYGFANSHSQLGPFVTQPMMGMTAGGSMPGYQAIAPSGDEGSGFAANGKRSNGFPASTVAPSVSSYGGTPAAGFGAGLSPVSPVSPDGMCGTGQVDNSAAQYGLDMAAVLRGRKRIIDGPVEKVVERRQRRMIKNRESAARSRARKQAYTVELEAELNQLREENAQLKQALAEMERQKKQQQCREEQQPKHVPERFPKLKALRRSQSCRL